MEELGWIVKFLTCVRLLLRLCFEVGKGRAKVHSREPGIGFLFISSEFRIQVEVSSFNENINL